MYVHISEILLIREKMQSWRYWRKCHVISWKEAMGAKALRKARLLVLCQAPRYTARLNSLTGPNLKYRLSSSWRRSRVVMWPWQGQKRQDKTTIEINIQKSCGLNVNAVSTAHEITIFLATRPSRHTWDIQHRYSMPIAVLCTSPVFLFLPWPLTSAGNSEIVQYVLLFPPDLIMHSLHLPTHNTLAVSKSFSVRSSGHGERSGERLLTYIEQNKTSLAATHCCPPADWSEIEKHVWRMRPSTHTHRLFYDAEVRLGIIKYMPSGFDKVI